MRTSSRRRSTWRSRSSRRPNAPELVGAHAVIWTTTPWTIPVNQAIAYGPEVDYVLASTDLSGLADGRRSRSHGSAIRSQADVASIASRSMQSFSEAWRELPSPAERRKRCEVGAAFVAMKRTDLLRMRWCSSAQGSASPAPIAPPPDAPPRRILREAAPVPRPATSSPPTRAPASSTWRPTMARTISCCARPTASSRSSRSKATANIAPTGRGSAGRAASSTRSSTPPTGRSARDLREAGALLAASADFRTATRIQWRSKAKVIYRCTPQWFIPMDKDCRLPWDGRAATGFDVPTNPQGDTLRGSRSTPSQRPASSPKRAATASARWSRAGPTGCISRQRAWGVPIALFVNRADRRLSARPRGQCAHRCRRSTAGGVDAWSATARRHFLGADYAPPTTSASPTSSTSGSTAARPMPSCSRARYWPDWRWPRRPLSRRLRPASRLVPVVAARKLRHARPGAVRGGADPRLHDGRQGQEDVQVARQHRRPAQDHRRSRAPTSCACGSPRPTISRT